MSTPSKQVKPVEKGDKTKAPPAGPTPAAAPLAAAAVPPAKEPKKDKKDQATDKDKKKDKKENPEEKKDAATLRREKFESVLIRRFFFAPAFEIYGGIAGLYDYGPPGCALFHNLEAFWRQHFVLHENMLEIYGPGVTPEPVLKASGHVERFTDYMVKDVDGVECYRADKILEEFFEKKMTTAPEDPQFPEWKRLKGAAGAMKQEELDATIQKFDVRAPDSGKVLGPSYPFNLMFKTDIGPTGKVVGYLRPETAQGIFVNFRRLQEIRGGKLPFACAQIGSAFRNEIAPRAGLIRVREFTLAEIEHFVDPDNKTHPRFPEIKDFRLSLLSQAGQEGGNDKVIQMAVGEAVAKGVINSETLGYFLARTAMFLLSCGIHEDKLRFRQHQKDEMAHYAKDCWDAEIKTTYGWVECVGHADRAAFDLTNHMKDSGVDLHAREIYENPQEVEEHAMVINFPLLKKVGNMKAAQEYLKSLTKGEALSLKDRLDKQGPQPITDCNKNTFTLESAMFKVELRMVKKTVRSYLPAVIEPSFGLGRIFYAILEHAFSDEMYPADPNRVVLRVPACIAPTKCAITPITVKPEFMSMAFRLRKQFVQLSLSADIDESGVNIGRKYARADEVGTPFCLTIDGDSPADDTVTIRDRDSKGEQIRVKASEAPGIIHQFVNGGLTWAEAYNKYPRFLRPVKDDE